MPSQETLIEVAVAAARKAGDIHKDMFGKILRVDASLAHDVKLEADRLCEAVIMDTIRDSFPDHSILAEESGTSRAGEYIWYIDPLDGTVNFYYGIPYFCTTLACYRYDGVEEPTPDNMGVPLAAVTYAPPTDELIVGGPGLGVTLNGNPVRVRDAAPLSEAYFLTAFGGDAERLRFSREILLPLAATVRKMRNLGALAYDLANAAAGRATAVIQYGLKTWDVAAGRVLIESAGGFYHARRYAGGGWAMAAGAKGVEAELMAALESFV